ncbi:MAG: tetratricopeptide repeat protein, partial [Polyangiaceae bacterium]
MELEERLSYLENVRDWQGLVDELEKGIAASAVNADKARLHLKLGIVLETKFLAGVKALKHFQDAYKLNPALVESLESARQIYWGLGKLNMVQKLLELELKAGADGARASALLAELGDVFCDQGEWDKAASSYARALAASGGKSTEASACLEDAQVSAGNWQERLSFLLRAATDEGDPVAKARLLLRTSRIARRFAPEEVEGLLARAYAADARSVQVAALYEGILAEEGRFGALEEAQRQVVQAARAADARGSLSLIVGIRWILRHQNAELGARFLE